MTPAPTALARALALGTACCVLASCATTHLPPISAHSGGFAPARDEARLWQQAREEERKLREEATLYHDPLLEDYLEQIVARLSPPELARSAPVRLRVTVLDDPSRNAFAYPHGSLYIHTGLLARMENEDQLATVLAHELTHVDKRHMLRYQRSARNKMIAWGVASVVGSAVAATQEAEALEQGDYSKAVRYRLLSDLFLGVGLALAVVAAIHGYGRELEREADEGAFERMRAAGYDVRQAPAVYRALMEEHGEPGKLEVFFFGSHPQLASRIEAAEAWLAAHPGTSATPRPRDEATFVRRLRPVLRDDARRNLELGRLELAQFELERAIRWLPADPEAHALLGQVLLERAAKAAQPQERERYERQAQESLLEAVRLDPERAAAHRDLGLLAYRQGRYPEACTHLNRYVERAPEAEDSPRIRDYLLELQQMGACAGPDDP